MFRASLSFGRWHGRGFSWFKFPKHCGSVFTYKQKARQQEILSSGKSGKEIRTEAGYCISAPLSSLWHCMECRGQADGIPKHCRVFKMPSKLQLKLEVRLETELNVLEKCWFGCFVGLCWEDALFCFGTRKNCKHEKKREKNPTKKSTNPHFESWNLNKPGWISLASLVCAKAGGFAVPCDRLCCWLCLHMEWGAGRNFPPGSCCAHSPATSISK